MRFLILVTHELLIKFCKQTFFNDYMTFEGKLTLYNDNDFVFADTEIADTGLH